MASQQSTVDVIVGNLMQAGEVSAKKMFGEYGIYCDGKMASMVCDDQLFVKPTKGGRDFVGAVVEAAPYPGAKPCLLIDAGRREQTQWLSELIRITVRELPAPKQKK